MRTKARLQDDDIIDLDAFALARINLIASHRSAAREATKNHSLKHSGDFSEFGLHYVGAMGEFAVAKYLGLVMDDRILPGPDDGEDMQSPVGSIQIKTRTFSGKKLDLFFNTTADLKASIAVGVQVVNPTRVRIFGWIMKDKFIEGMVLKNYGYGSRATVSEDKLTHISALLDKIQNHAA